VQIKHKASTTKHTNQGQTKHNQGQTKQLTKHNQAQPKHTPKRTDQAQTKPKPKHGIQNKPNTPSLKTMALSDVQEDQTFASSSSCIASARQWCLPLSIVSELVNNCSNGFLPLLGWRQPCSNVHGDTLPLLIGDRKP
jgi:hypothetical protein